MLESPKLAHEILGWLKAVFSQPRRPTPTPNQPTYDWRAWGVGAWCGLVATYAAQAIVAAELELPFSPTPIAVIPGLLAAYLFARPLQGQRAAPLNTVATLARRVAVTCGGLAIALLLLSPAPAATGAHAATVTEALVTTPLIAAVELTLNTLAIAAGIALAARLLPRRG